MAPGWMPKSTSLDYKLPPTVKSIQKGWLYSLRISALISGLFVITAAILLIFEENSTTSIPLNASKVLLALGIMGYVSLFLNVSACMSCFILVDRLGELPYHAAQDRQLTKGGTVTLQQQDILRLYGIGALWPWVVWHWFFCFALGTWSIFAQVMLHIWIHEPKEVKVVLTSLACFCCLPFFAFILAPGINLVINLSSSTLDVTHSPTAASPDIESMTPRSPTSLRSTTPTTAVPPRTPVRTSGNFRFPSSPRPTNPIYEAKPIDAMRAQGHMLSGHLSSFHGSAAG